MKKGFIIVSITLMALIALTIGAIYAVMHTSYAPQFVSKLLSHVTPYQISVNHARYTPPLQLSLEEISLDDGNQLLQLPKVELWLNQAIIHKGKLAFDSILIEQANIDLKELNSDWFDSIFTYQLALKQVDIDAGNWSARDVNFQVDNPQWHDVTQTIPYGDIQLSAKQLYIKGEALNDLLLDARYQAKESTIFGSSFRWRGANISGQAEQYPQGWSLINVTVDKLQIPSSTPAIKLVNTLTQLNLPIYHINSLDILNSSFSHMGWRFSHLDASIEELLINQEIWQQQDAYLSFNADKIAKQGIELLSPQGKLSLRDAKLSIQELDTDFKQGRVQLSGVVTPNLVALEQLHLNGIKWLEQTHTLLPAINEFISPLEELTVKRLSVENGQFIQVEQQPYWQLSGLNIEGSDLHLVKQSTIGLHSGSLEVSANSASFDKLISTQTHLKAQSHLGNIALERVFIPLEQGYIEANGQWNTNSKSAPWQLSLHADGLPLEQNIVQQYLPFKLSGLAELEVELSGLSGDYAMYAHSLTGRVNTTIHDGKMEAKSANGEQSFVQQWHLPMITLSADRGRVTLHAQSVLGELAGKVDLTKPDFATLLYQTTNGCQELWSDILDRANVIKATCDQPDGEPITQSEEPITD